MGTGVAVIVLIVAVILVLVLIGLFNNGWTERLVGKLRFTIEHPGPGKS